MIVFSVRVEIHVMTRRYDTSILRGIIYHIFYIPEVHHSPEGTMTLRAKIQVIAYFETLREADKETVPDDRYRIVNDSVYMKSEFYAISAVKNIDGGEGDAGGLQ